MISTGAILKTTVDDLHQRLKIMRQPTIRNERGDIIPAGEPVEVGKAWAKVLPKAATKGEEETESQNKISYSVVIRYRADLLPDDFIVWQGKEYEIITPPYDAESRKIWLAFEMRELIADGKK